MIKPTQKYALVERKKVKETNIEGFVTTSNETDAHAVKAKVVDIHPDFLDGIKIGDIVYVYKVKALSVQDNDELFFVEPEHIVGWETAQ